MAFFSSRGVCGSYKSEASGAQARDYILKTRVKEDSYTYSDFAFSSPKYR